MVLPDFLIVGAAKCGTTSLYNYLSQHDEIYLNKNKEPKYFVSKFLKFPLGGKGDNVTEELMVKSFKEYLSLFQPKQPHQITGEASVDYFFYADEVIEDIKSTLGDVKIIIMLRNPTERAFSAYKHLVRDVRETESFEKGLKLEHEREKRNYEFIWYYKKAGFYYESVKKYKENFSKVHVINFDDFIEETNRVMEELFIFLKVNPKFSIEKSTIYNKTGSPKSKFLQRALVGSPNQIMRKAGRFLFSKRRRKKIREILENKNLNDKGLYLREDTRAKLDEIYANDLRLLKDDFGINLMK